jgi:hypothetical protein
MTKKLKLFFSLGLLLFFFHPGISWGENTADPVARKFSGEIIHYEVGFWIFFPVGGGVVDFRDLGHGKYMVFHEGKAQGFVGWLTSYRREIYRSTMGTINNGQRLIPLRFEEHSVIGDWFRKKTTVYDYAARRVFMEVEKEGEKSREEVEIPLGALYDDPVTAFYNFRAGVYGKVEPGREFLVRTLPEKGSAKGKEEIRLIVASKDEADILRAKEPDKAGKDFFVRILLDREMWGKKKGELEIWFNKDIVPTSGVVKDIRFFGDIRGKLTYRGFQNALATSRLPPGKEPAEGK